MDHENKEKSLDYINFFRKLEINPNTISYGSGLILSENINNNYLSISNNNFLRYEINNLDQEIKVLQDKFKVMIDKKKK